MFLGKTGSVYGSVSGLGTPQPAGKASFDTPIVRAQTVRELRNRNILIQPLAPLTPRHLVFTPVHQLQDTPVAQAPNPILAAPQAQIVALNPVAAQNNFQPVGQTDSEDEMTEATSMLPNFSGTGDHNAADWLSLLNDYVAYKGLNEATRLSFFKLKLSQVARNWLLALPDAQKDTFDHLATAFNQRFAPRELDRHKLVTELFNVRQKADESVDAYIAKVARRAQILNIGDQMAVHAAKNGLLPPISAYVLENQANTLDEVLQHARVAEVTRASPFKTENELQHQIAKLSDEVLAISAQMNRLTTAAVREREPSPMKTTRNVTFAPQQGPSTSRRYEQTYYRPRQNRQPFNGQSPSQPREGDQDNTQDGERPTQGNLATNDCHRCARRNGHPQGVPCPMMGQACFRCGKLNHAARCCRSRETQGSTGY